jgi:hypothetical protein
MDREYLDFDRLYALDQAGSFLVTRPRRNMNARRVYSAAFGRGTRCAPSQEHEQIDRQTWSLC